MNLSFGSLGGSKSTPPARKNSIDVEQPDENSPAKGTSGFSSKLGDYGRSISGMSKKVTSAASALVMSDEKEKTPQRPNVERQKQVEQLVEHFRLQCPQTHLGLVVAFSSTTLAPLIDSNVKFKWYRMGDNMEQFKQIDEGARGWYPPTADDIGKKICANCEDTLDQGFCRYAEAGPIEADPLLCSTVETALENGRYEAKDVSISFGLKAIDPCDPEASGLSTIAATRGLATDSATLGHFNMSSPDRSSSLVSTNSPFFKVTHNISVEVGYQGIFLNGAMFIDDMDLSSQRGKRGLQIFSSPKLEISCALPASIILVVPTIKGKTSENNSPNVDNTEDSESSPSPEETPQSPNEVDNNNVDDDGYIPYEWIGDTHGEIHEAFQDFIQSLPSNATSFRICFACSDRMIRDTLMLTCKSLSNFNTDVGARDRLISLPWYSAEGIRHTAKVQSLTGNDLSNRLKTLEEENAALKRQQMELNLQVMEYEQHQLMAPSNLSSLRHTSDDVSKDPNNEDASIERSQSGSTTDHKEDAAANQQQQQLVSQLKTKQRDQEKVIATLKHKEMEYEKTVLELSSSLKNTKHELESQTATNNELKQKVVDLHTEANGMKVVAEKYQIEATELREKYSKEVAQLHSQVDSLTKELSEKNALIATQKEQLDDLSTNISEKNQTVTQLRDRILGLKSDLDDQKNHRESLEHSLTQSKEELHNLTQQYQEKDTEIITLQQIIQQLTIDKEKLSEELATLTNHKLELETRSISRQDYDELESKLQRVSGERNHFQQMTQSLGKELKRVLKASDQQVKGLTEDLESQKDMYERLMTQFNELKTTMEEETRKRQEEEVQKSKGFFSRKKTEPVPPAAAAAAANK